ncbi:MAG: sulfotransferase domain-containing protein, partial [Ignavibacteriae bacterium]|nr:sulfotransferase domain-containing protein [Ignavibacteriota bacterium]
MKQHLELLYKIILHSKEYILGSNRLKWYLLYRRYLIFARNRNSKIVLISSVPKTGSTYLSKLLAKSLGFKYSSLVSNFNQIEHDLYEPGIIDNFGKGIIAHQHMRAADVNVEFILKYKIPTIVLIRNIYDTIVSIYDHTHNETFLWPMCHLNSQFFTKTTEEKYDIIIDSFTPWILNFYNSWQDFATQGQAIIIKYESLINNKANTLKEI